MLPWVMLADVIDLDELTTGKRREGLFSAFLVSLSKVVAGVALALSGVLRAAGGYTSNSAPPAGSPELDRTFRLLCGVIPVILAMLMVPLLLFYPITASEQRRIRRDLDQKRRQLLAGGPDEAVMDTAEAGESSASFPALAPSDAAATAILTAHYTLY